MGRAGFFINGAAVILIIFFNIMFCFRKYLLLDLGLSVANMPLAYTNPFTVSSMNYNSVILAGVLAITTLWWFVHSRKHYPGPKLAHLIFEGQVVDLPKDR